MPSRMSSIVRQFCTSDMRCCGDRLRIAPRPVTSPATTAATRPDAPSASLGTEARNGTVNEMTVFTVASVTRERTQRLALPTR